MRAVLIAYQKTPDGRTMVGLFFGDMAQGEQLSAYSLKRREGAVPPVLSVPGADFQHMEQLTLKHAKILALQLRYAVRKIEKENNEVVWLQPEIWEAAEMLPNEW